jgi:hypothetical protein
MIQYAAAAVIESRVLRVPDARWGLSSGGRSGDPLAGMTTVCGWAYPCAEAGCFALASIWPIASTTASKVNMVEAWRAL